MSTRLASDEVTDGIAAIEVHRQGTEKELGLAAACSEALRKLQAFLEQEKANLALNLQDPIAQANVDAVENELRRVQSLAGIKGQGARNARPREQAGPRLDGNAHNPPRNRGRRNMGRSGGRGGRSGGGGGR
ncbi:MAG: hypothetical protein ABIH03_13605 [Pseudomonadota bacterium]